MHNIVIVLPLQHDTTMVALLENFGAFSGIFPPYASALFVELHLRSGEFVVEVMLRFLANHVTV